MEKNIVIVGFPKSGTTWATRLVAELVGCPIGGNWGFSGGYQPIKEGIHRVSEFTCFKSHHPYHDIFEVWQEKKIHKLIYIVRDPRDVVISGANFFTFPSPLFRNLFKSMPGRQKVYSIAEKFSNRLLSFENKKKRMINAVINGDEAVDFWCRSSWEQHYLPYFNDKSVFFTTYEEVLAKPERFCENLLQALGMSRDQAEIFRAIEDQSFSKRKTQFIKNDDAFYVKLLRKGESGYWKEELTDQQKQLFKERLGKNLVELGYVV